ncbi:MAG: TIGR00266 family protein [Alphaproteobacteria bacterium]|nr:TIGR00266 family protein [Alphaproteobacteria bacterium]
MQIDILERPSNTVARLTFARGEEITAEGGSMVAMSSGLDARTTTHKKGRGGIGRALKRMVGGESFFLNHYTSERDGAELFLAPALSGDMLVHDLGGGKPGLVVQGSSFLAQTKDVDLDLGWQGLKSLFSGEGLFWLRVGGRGTVILNAFGMIYPVDVNGDYIVDTGHIVAFEDSLKFKISKVGASWMSSFLGGEGFVCRFEGKGRVWCQSHSPGAFGAVLGPMLLPREQ